MPGGRVMGQDPVIRVVLAAVGALAGASLSSDGDHLFGIVMGALAGLALFEALYIRDRLTKLERELQAIREARQQARPTPVAVPDPVQSGREAVPDLPPTPPARVSPPQPPPAAASTKEKVPYTDVPSWTSPHSLGTAPARQENPIVALLREYFTGGNALVRAG